MMVKLPNELIDLFIDQFSHEKSTLDTLSLVHRNWLPRTRKHLFREIELLSQTTTTFEEFYEFLLSTRFVCLCIQNLTLTGQGGDGGTITFDLLRNITFALPNLGSLTVDCLELDDYTRPSSPPPLPDSRPRHLRRVRLNHVVTSGSTQGVANWVGDFLSSFEAVNELEYCTDPEHFFDRLPLLKLTDILPLAEEGSLSVRSLKLESARDAFILLPVFSYLLRPGELKRFDVVVDDYQGMASIGSFIGRHGASSEHLRLDVSSRIPHLNLPNPGWDTLQLSHCDSLKSFVIQLCIPSLSYPEFALSLQQVAPILSLLNSSSLCIEMISIQLDLGEYSPPALESYMDHVSWDRLDTLCSGTFKNLNRLLFHFWNVRLVVEVHSEQERAGAFEGQVEYIANRLPTCKDKGILEFLLEGPSIDKFKRQITFRESEDT